MKTKILSILLVGFLVNLAAWFVYRSDNNPQAEVHAGERPVEEVPEKYRDTVAKGLAYLAKSQHQDGHWEGDGGKHPVAMTGLVGLALLMERDGSDRSERNGIAEGKHAANVRKAVAWLMAKSEAGRDGLIFSDHASETSRYMEGHGLATLFLAGTVEDEQDDARRAKLINVLTRAVKYIAKAQSSQGGWYHTSRVEGHDFNVISSTVIQIQALQAAENAGVPIPGETIQDARQYLRMALQKPEQNHNRLADTAAALACSGVSTTRSGDIEDSWAKAYAYCQTEVPVGRNIKSGRDELVHYYYAQAMYADDGKVWNGYRTAVFDSLQRLQNKDGSWPAGDGISVGPVYATALWCTILQLDRNSHPSTRRVYKIK